MKISTEKSGGWKVKRDTNGSAATVVVAAGQGAQCGGWWLINTVASIRYLHLYDTIAGATPASTDTPKLTILLAASGTERAFGMPCGFDCSAGLSYRCTTDLAGTTLATASDVLIQVLYK